MTVKELHASQEKLHAIAKHAQHSGSADMTAEVAEMVLAVKELHTFTDADIATISDALKIADAQYRAMAESMHAGFPGFRHTLEEQARTAADLLIKIEAAQ